MGEFMNSVVIVDYGMGNIGSIVNMLKSVSVKAEVTGDPQRILAAKKIILPGVGAFDHGMENLRARQLIEPLQHKVLTENTGSYR